MILPFLLILLAVDCPPVAVSPEIAGHYRCTSIEWRAKAESRAVEIDKLLVDRRACRVSLEASRSRELKPVQIPVINEVSVTPWWVTPVVIATGVAAGAVATVIALAATGAL